MKLQPQLKVNKSNANKKLERALISNVVRIPIAPYIREPMIGAVKSANA